MLFETVKTEGLAQLSYVFGDEDAGVCAVIDPRRDVEVYLDIARRAQVRVTHILETHVHADFVSGSRELAARTGADIYVGASGEYGFEHRGLGEGDVLELGSLRLRVLHTPGHSPEHLSFVLSGGGKGAEDEWAVFTGDTLFAGEVGRPDLAGEDQNEALARRLYSSLHEKLLELDDGVEVYPAHGAGSPCGANIGARDHTTVGYERQHNPKLKLDENEFVEQVLGELSQDPFYYARTKRVNAAGPALLGALPALPALSAEQFQAEMEGENALVLDTREIEAFAGAHVGGALNIALRDPFPIWAGWMLRPEQRLLLVAKNTHEVEQARRHLLRVGLENVVGYLRRGMPEWLEAGLPFTRLEQLSVHELKSQENVDSQVLDVRKTGEYESGHVPGARHVFVPFLKDHLGELDKDSPLAVYCSSGYRASIAASFLQGRGFKVKNVPGSVQAWRAAGYGLENAGKH